MTVVVFAVLGGMVLSIFLWDWIGALAWVGPAFVGYVFLGCYCAITSPPVNRMPPVVPKCH